MKKIVMLLFYCMSVTYILFAQTEKFYYTFNENKIRLRVNNSKSVLLFNNITTQKNINFLQEYEKIGINAFIVPSSLDFSLFSDYHIIPSYFIESSTQEIYYTNELVLKYKDNISAELIHNIEVEFGLSIVQKNSIYNLYTCKQDALSVSNKIYEKGIVEFCTPNFITKTQNYSYPNDTYFDKQWYLHNTGQGTNDNKTTTPDADIDALEAWQITKGSPNVIVAVIDEGITNNHPDLPLTRQVRLPGSNFAYQYDGSNNPNDPSPTLSYYSGNNHGNACAGIIAATQGNNEGITGIAPLCKIMPIKIPFGNFPASIYADAITFAVNNNADILSNSWGYGSNNPNLMPVIVSAIDNAVSKGKLIVFAAGNTADKEHNNNGFVTFPACSNIPDLVVVGASDRNNKQANYSPTNSLIDIAAPSHTAYNSQINGESFNIWTIDIPGAQFGYNNWRDDADGLPEVGEILPNYGGNNTAYTGRMGGTSAACPQVAAVLALIKSIDPNLTSKQVLRILFTSADKVGEYNYYKGHSSELGYGKLNAYTAVKMAKVLNTPADLLIRDYVGDDGEEPSYGYNGWLYNLVQHNPDIKLLDIDTQQPIHSIGMYKKKNCYIAVNIKNIGGKTTEGNGKERLHLFSQSYLITTLPKYALPYYERLTPTKGLPIGKLAYNEQKVAAGLFNWELPEKKLKATAERLKEAFPSVNNPIWGFDILAIADENGNSIIKSTADTIFIAHGAEDIARRYNSAAMGYWQRRTLWDDIFNQIIRILPTANKPFSLSLSQPVDIKRGRIKDFAEVNILLSNSLMAKLITAGNPNIKVIDQNRVRLLSADAKLEFRPMSNNKEDYFAGVEVKFFSDLLPQINSFDFGLSYSEQGKEPEMVHFTAIRNSSVYFKAQAEASKTQVAGNETVTLTATNIGDEATYTWYNRSGNVIGTGTSITTVPTATDTYTLEVEREDNGYKSYGEVEVVALAGKIVSLSPNPAHSTLTVKYKLPDNTVIASIQITNIQNNISKTYAISTTATEKTISLESLSVGSYIVKLIADGKTLHSQNLLIK
mgnify:FL=1